MEEKHGIGVLWSGADSPGSGLTAVSPTRASSKNEPTSDEVASAPWKPPQSVLQTILSRERDLSEQSQVRRTTL